MKVATQGHTTVVTDTKENLTAFLMKLTHEYKTFEKNNLIVDISVHKSITLRDITAFSPLAKDHKKAKKSFVLVVPDFDYNKVPASINVVPTLQEAHDLVEMDEIERDLGF